MRPWIMLAAALACTGVRVGTTAEPHAKRVTVDKEQIQQLITQLEAKEEPQREAAARELTALGEVAIGPLRQAYQRNTGSEFRARAQKVLNSLIGPTVAGLALSLRADRQKLKLGEEVVFTVTFWNYTAKPLNVRWGRQYGKQSTDLTEGLCGVAAEGKEQVIGQAARIGLPLPENVPARAVLQTLTPLSGSRARLHAKYLAGIVTLHSGKPERTDQKVLAVGNDWSFVIQEPGVRRFVFYLEAEPGEEKQLGDPAPKDPQAPCWAGKVFSNEVQLTFEPPAPEGKDVTH